MKTNFRQKYNNLLQRFIRLFSLSSVAFVLTACYGCPYAEYDVEGYVYDENGNMLENMQVVVRTFDQEWDYPDTVYTIPNTLLDYEPAILTFLPIPKCASICI